MYYVTLCIGAFGFAIHNLYKTLLFKIFVIRKTLDYAKTKNSFNKYSKDMTKKVTKEYACFVTYL